nr:MAG TPA: hypothetical protein [Caudoviricetes sp.]
MGLLLGLDPRTTLMMRPGEVAELAQLRAPREKGEDR